MTTVCDQGAVESCPIIHGHPTKVHWGASDSAKVSGSTAENTAAFDADVLMLKERIEQSVSTAELSRDSKGQQRSGDKTCVKGLTT